MTINESDDPRWLELYAALLAAPSDRIFDEDLLAELGAHELWEWAAVQRGPVVSERSPWLAFTEDSTVGAVRAGLPVWTGILALHPSSATMVQRLTREVPLVSLFAQHARQEWDALLEAGVASPFPAALAYVPRDGRWESVLARAQDGRFDVPAGTTLRRTPSDDAPRPHTARPASTPMEVP